MPAEFRHIRRSLTPNKIPDTAPAPSNEGKLEYNRNQHVMVAKVGPQQDIPVTDKPELPKQSVRGNVCQDPEGEERSGGLLQLTHKVDRQQKDGLSHIQNY